MSDLTPSIFISESAGRTPDLPESLRTKLDPGHTTIQHRDLAVPGDARSDPSRDAMEARRHVIDAEEAFTEKSEEPERKETRANKEQPARYSGGHFRSPRSRIEPATDSTAFGEPPGDR